MNARTVLVCSFTVALAAAAPAPAATDVRCAQALAKASVKFVSVALKATQHCMLLRAAGKLPATACRVRNGSTGDSGTDAALRAARTRLGDALRPCPDALVSHMGFASSCAGGTAVTRAALASCLESTHVAAVQALAAVEVPVAAGSDTCGNGTVDPDEDCDPAAMPTGCDPDEVCIGPGALDSCTCEDAADACGNGTIDSGEQCDPAATPSGCPGSAACISAGQPNACTCATAGPITCEGSCSTACATGEHCSCACVGATVNCGNGTVDVGEQCDPMASPNGCATGMVCSAPGTATACQCTTQSGACGNGVLDAGENCDPAIPVNNCDPGEICLTSGPLACKCGAPPTNCGNGVIEWGEQCEPTATPTGCNPGETCSTSCTCTPGGGGTTTTLPVGVTTTTVPGGSTTTLPPGVTTTTVASGATTTTTTVPGGGGCSCGAQTPHVMSFTTATGSGTCGSVKNDAGQSFFTLSCSGLYFGGAGVGVPLPAKIPDQGTSMLKVASCSGTKLTLSSLAAGESGATQRTCSASGCLFGPPLPIPNPNSPPTSTCVVNTISQNATGTGDCAAGSSTVTLPLSSRIFLTGDLFDDIPGIQPCPLCRNGKCRGGQNDGKPCTPGDSASLGDAYPTSHDCPPNPAQDIGALPISFALTTGTTAKTAIDLPNQPAVFCGFCRHPITKAFKKPAVPCKAQSDCASLAPFNSCEQHTSGAFTADDVGRTITLTGKPAGNMTDGGSHPSTLVSIFCIPPTFTTVVDSAGDLAGPGAVSIPGQAKLSP